jgi:hypothetical protein
MKQKLRRMPRLRQPLRRSSFWASAIPMSWRTTQLHGSGTTQHPCRYFSAFSAVARLISGGIKRPDHLSMRRSQQLGRSQLSGGLG